MSIRRTSEELELERAIEAAVADGKTREIVDSFINQTRAGQQAFLRMERYEGLLDIMATESMTNYRFRESFRGAVLLMENNGVLLTTAWSMTEVDEPPPEVEIATVG